MGLLSKINHAWLWNRRVKVEGFAFRACSLDRFVYLCLQKFRFMGRSERAVFSKYVKPGMIVVDAGANVGVYSLWFARLVGPEGKVFAFEPHPRLHAALRETIEANGMKNIIPIAKALGSCSASLAIKAHGLNSGDTSLSATRSGSDETLVDVVAMDETLEGVQLDFVKIDVQGWEPEVFFGMKRLMRANPNARIHFEFMPFLLRRAGFRPADLFEYLSGEGWDVTTEDGKTFTREDAVRWDDGGRRCTNLLAFRSGDEAQQT